MRSRRRPESALLSGAIFSLLCSGGAVSAADLPAMPVKAQVQSFDQRWQVTFNDEVQYYSWDSSQGYPHLPLQLPADPKGPGHGSQVYNPYGLQIDGKATDDLQVQFLVRSGYVWSSQTTGGVSTSASTPTDTTLGTTLTYNGIAGIQPFASLNVNAPTGKTVLMGNSAFARPDPDLSGVPTFGEGWNIGPTIGINVPITAQMVASFSTGYTSRGTYTREGVIPLVGAQGTDSIKPGNDWTVNTSLAYQASGLTLQLSGTYVLESETFIDGVPLYKTGDRITVSGGAGYTWTPAWSSQLTASFTHIDRNIVQNLFAPPPLIVEAANSNSNVTQLVASTTYTQGSFAIGPTAGFTYRDHNDYDPTSATFLPAKTSYSAGAMAQYLVNQMASLSLRAEHRWVHEDINPDKMIGIFGILPGSGFPAISSTGWMVSLGGTIKF